MYIILETELIVGGDIEQLHIVPFPHKLILPRPTKCCIGLLWLSDPSCHDKVREDAVVIWKWKRCQVAASMF